MFYVYSLSQQVWKLLMMIVIEKLIQIQQMIQSFGSSNYLDDDSKSSFSVQKEVLSKIYRIYQITRQLSDGYIVETYSQNFISKFDVRNIQAGQRNLIRKTVIEPQNTNQIYCLHNYPNNVLTYLQKKGKSYGVPYILIERDRRVESYPKFIVKFEALQICVKEYLRKYIKIKSVVINLAIKINQSFDGLASLGLCVFKLCLSNLRIKKCIGNEIQVKNFDFTHTLMFSIQKDREGQNQLLKYLQQLVFYQIGRRDFADILDELSRGSSLRAIRKFYDLYYQQIIQQIINIIEQKQEINQDQKQMAELLKTYQCIGENPRNKFIQKLKENQELSQSNNINSFISDYLQDQQKIFTEKSLLQIFEKYDCFSGKTRLIDYKSNVLIPILCSQQGRLMDIPIKKLKFIEENIRMMEQQILQLDSEDDIIELTQMIALLRFQINRNQKNAFDTKPIITRPIQKEKSTSNIYGQDSVNDHYQRRKKVMMIKPDNIENNILSESILADLPINKSIKNEQKQSNKPILQQKQRQTRNSNLSMIIQEMDNERQLNDSTYNSFLQNIKLQEAQAQSIIIFTIDISRESTLANLEHQEDKIKQFHNKLVERGFQGQQTYQLIQSINFKRIAKNEKLIFNTLLQKYNRIREYMLEQTLMLKIMRSHNYQCKNLKSWAKSLQLVVGYYFKHQYDDDDSNLYRIIKQEDDIVLSLQQCKQLIGEVKQLIRKQKCMIYRKFKEQIILSVFSNPAYFEDNPLNQNSRASPKKDGNLTRLSQQRQTNIIESIYTNQTGRSQKSFNINPVDYQRLHKYQAIQPNSDIPNNY